MNLVRSLGRHPVGYLRSQCILRISRNASTSDVKDAKDEEDLVENIEDEEAKALREAEIEKKRNKSRLYPDHYALYHGENPYPEPAHQYHYSLRYKRRSFGKYGESSGVDPSVLWPTKEELADRAEYDALAHPHTIPEMVEIVKKAKMEEAKARLARETDVAAKALKIEQWKREFHDRIRKKAEEAARAREKKDRLVEEIRRHFGFKIDPKDERFKEMMEKKEREAKKLGKAERQKARDMKMLADAQAAEDNEKAAKTAAREEEDDDDEDEMKKKKK